MRFTTEFKINLQSTKDEDAYMKKLYEVVQSVVPTENKVSDSNNINIEYISPERANLVSFDWKVNTEEKDAPYYTNTMQRALKGVKWLRKHCLREVAFIYN